MKAEKSSGFFHLFDWNRKSRKKLFSNSPEGSKKGKLSDDNLPATRFRLADEDELAGASSAKGSGSYSCASSVTDDEGISSRVPGVVARLMGLDSLPTSGVAEPYSTPLFDSRSLRDNRSQKRSPDFYASEIQLADARRRVESYSRKPMELRPQKVPSSPIERFQTETLPPRSAKSLPITHNKLLSPIKNSSFVSAKNAAHIMEAAAKIIEPGLQSGPTSRGVAPYMPSSIPLKVRDPRENTVVSRRSRPLEPPRRAVEPNTARIHRGQPLNRSWDGTEDGTILKPILSPDETNSIGTKSKGKSISLAIQAKVNVQRREGLSTGNQNTFVYADQDECKLSQPAKNLQNNQKNRLQRKTPVASIPSGVLKHNSQKQNCVSSKDRLASKQSVANHQGKKVHSRDSDSGRNKTIGKLPGNSKVVYRKEGDEKEGMSSNSKNLPRKKRLLDGNLVDKQEKIVQTNVVIDEHSCLVQDKGNGADVVSFTFNSPMIKPMPVYDPPPLAVERWDKRKAYSFEAHSKNCSSDSKDKQLSSLGLNSLSGDALSLLLEQKLRELTSVVDPCHRSFGKAGSFALTPDLLQSTSTSDTIVTTEAENEKEHFRPFGDCRNESSLSSVNGQVFGMKYKLQEEEEVECSSSTSHAQDPDHQHRSPFSILEACFSNESVGSSQSSGSTHERKMCSSSVQAQNVVDLSHSNKIPSPEADMELSDSASSTFKETAVEHTSVITCEDSTDESEPELEYVREILRHTEIQTKDLGYWYLAHSGAVLDPALFNMLENKRSATKFKGDYEVMRGRRKLLFDCMRECLDSKCGLYFNAGYQTWSKGVAHIGKDLAPELYKDMLAWEGMGDWIVDELVDKDMSSGLGRWIDFEIEAFEAGVEIESEILGSLIDELVADISN